MFRDSSADWNVSCADEYVVQILLLSLHVAGRFKNTAASAPTQTSQDATGEQRMECVFAEMHTHIHRNIVHILKV